MIKRGLLFTLLTSFIFAEDLELTKEQENPKEPTLLEKIIEKEKQYSVPRETVPVEEIKYLIDTPIPKTAYHLPLLQPLFNIEPGTLPNPIGISLIGSYTSEQYTITKFKGTLGSNLGNNIINAILNPTNPKIVDGIIDGAARGLLPILKRDKDQVIAAIMGSNLDPLTKGLLQTGINNLEKLPPALAIPLLKTLLKTQGTAIIRQNSEAIANFIDGVTGSGKQKEWKLSEGTVKTKTSAIGLKADLWILPFMNLFATATYLNMEQHTTIGSATLPLDRPIGNLNSITFPIGSLESKLNGYAVMGGTNIAIGYKGFFASFMISGGYVQLDDTQNNIKGFVEKPFMYLAPRIGYSYNGIFTIHTGLQRVELFGATEGKDLSKLTGGLVSNYSVEVKKFPVTFLAGAQFMFMRDLGLSIEYVGSPDTNGLNAELAFRF